MHKHGVIHNDLASRNILVHTVGKKTTLYVSDFGLSQMIKDKGRQAQEEELKSIAQLFDISEYQKMSLIISMCVLASYI